MDESPDFRFQVVLTKTATDMLRQIGKKYGKKTYETLRDLIAGLEHQPDQKGEALHRPLQGLHSLHYSRFRVIYRIESGNAIVLVVAAGHHASGERDDIYQIIRRLVENGTIEIKSQPPRPKQE